MVDQHGPCHTCSLPATPVLFTPCHTCPVHSLPHLSCSLPATPILLTPCHTYPVHSLPHLSCSLPATLILLTPCHTYPVHSLPHLSCSLLVSFPDPAFTLDKGLAHFARNLGLADSALPEIEPIRLLILSDHVVRIALPKKRTLESCDEQNCMGL